MEEQAARDAGLGSDGVEREVLDRLLHQHPQPDPEQLAPALVLAQPDPRLLRGVIGHAIEHCSIVWQGQAMDFAPSPRAAELTEQVKAFIETEIEPVEADYHRELKRRRHYMKPSVKRRKKMSEAARRRRKRLRADEQQRGGAPGTGGGMGAGGGGGGGGMF